MKAEDIMCGPVRCISPGESLVTAADLMRELDVGSLPICESDRLAGMITDRDIVVRVVAAGLDPAQQTVRDAMTDGILYGYADQDIADIAEIMEKHQIRRLPIVTREKRLVGVIATADLAREADAALTGEVLRDVSTPRDPLAG